MRRLIPFAVLAAFAAPALAGDPACPRCVEGFPCENECPLAQDANACRSTGTEALAVRSRLQADHAAIVAKNLARI